MGMCAIRGGGLRLRVGPESGCLLKGWRVGVGWEFPRRGHGSQAVCAQGNRFCAGRHLAFLDGSVRECSTARPVYILDYTRLPAVQQRARARVVCDVPGAPLAVQTSE